MVCEPSVELWFAWLSFVAPFTLISSFVITLWFSAQIAAYRARTRAWRDWPHARLVTRDPLGRTLL